MNNFELTERGKIVIAVVIVVILLVIPLVIILGISSCAGTPGALPDIAASPSIPSQLPGDETLNVLPPTPDDGFNPSDSAAAEPAEASEPTATPEPTPTPEPPSGNNGDDAEEGANGEEHIEYGPVGLDKTAGTMQFIFSPLDQKTLDEETVDMLSDFLSSPKNSSNSLIKIEIPNLSDEDEELLTSAVKEAFSQYNVPESKLLFISSGTSISEQRFEVAMAFTAISNQK